MIGCLLVLTFARNSVILNKNGDLVRVDDSTPISKQHRQSAGSTERDNVENRRMQIQMSLRRRDHHRQRIGNCTVVSLSYCSKLDVG